MSAPKVVETRKLTVSYEIEAAVYSDGTVGTFGWSRRTADGWKRISSDENYASDSRAEAKALYALALEVALRPDEPTRFGFVGTVTTPEGDVYDILAKSGDGGRKYFEAHNADGILDCWGFDKWTQVLELGTFTPRGDA